MRCRAEDNESTTAALVVPVSVWVPGPLKKDKGQRICAFK